MYSVEIGDVVQGDTYVFRFKSQEETMSFVYIILENGYTAYVRKENN